jgi:hypothetical protein
MGAGDGCGLWTEGSPGRFRLWILNGGELLHRDQISMCRGRRLLDWAQAGHRQSVEWQLMTRPRCNGREDVLSALAALGGDGLWAMAYGRLAMADGRLLSGRPDARSRPS